MTRDDRRGAVAWLAIVVPAWVVLALCTHWEPVLRDGWGHLRWHMTYDNSFAKLWEFGKGAYLGGNPRLGQTITLLLMTPGPYHAIATPIVELGMFGLLVTLLLGRAPSWRRSDDALLYATLIAIVMLATPQSGTLLFYRPFTGNYVYGFAINLAFLVPYRLHVAAARRVAWWWSVPAALVAGAIAGFCNEHTAPAIGVLAVVAIVISWRRDRAVPAWMIAGVVALACGWLELITAPGQALRYAGLATQATTVERIASRGFAMDVWIVVRMFVFLAAALPWLILGVVAARDAPSSPERRARLITALVAFAGTLVIGVTLLGSPKEGQRLYFAPCVLSAAAVAGWMTAQLVARWARLATLALTTCVLLYVGWTLVSTYAMLDTQYQARRALIAAGASRAIVVVPRYSIAHNWWTIGEDFDSGPLRQFVANTWDLTHIEITPTTAATQPSPP